MAGLREVESAVTQTEIPTLVKVGGSLYDLPDLGARLRRFIRRLQVERVVLFPGGGAAADTIRELDRVHDLREETAHWLALRALTVNAHFLSGILPELPVGLWPNIPAQTVLEPFAFFEADEKSDDRLPHCWSVTSDSLAVRAATLLGVGELVLLKSVAGNLNMTWPAAAEAGIVDPYFPTAMRGAPGLKVRLVNLRQELG